MTGKPRAGASWHRTSVVLRQDLYRRALEQGIDISDACNRALATLTGGEYPGRHRKEGAAPPPVIIAKDGSSPRGSGEPEKAPPQNLHPVINADDPDAPARVVRAKAAEKKIAPPEPADPVPEPGTATEMPDAAPEPETKKAPGRKRRTASAKKGSGKDALKIFFSARIIRSGDEDDRISKDDLYELFARFCRDSRITPVLERKTVTVALKNQFALTEKNRDGIPCWTGIRLK